MRELNILKNIALVILGIGIIAETMELVRTHELNEKAENKEITNQEYCEEKYFKNKNKKSLTINQVPYICLEFLK